jgi:hypothetical protein
MHKELPERTPFDGIPYVGCAATVPLGSDCYPATVVWVNPKLVEVTLQDGRKLLIPKSVRIRGCEYKGVEGHSNAYTEDQRYVYLDDEAPVWRDNEEYSYRDARKGYVRVGTSSRSSAAQRLGFGYRRAYRDPCF